MEKAWRATSSPNPAANSLSPPTSTTSRFHPTLTPHKMSPAKLWAKSPPPLTTPGCEWNSYRHYFTEGSSQTMTYHAQAKITKPQRIAMPRYDFLRPGTNGIPGHHRRYK